MKADDDRRSEWIEAAFEELAVGGIDRVRVEVVAGRLGVTKGGFYRRFKDRRALLDAMLMRWRDGRIAAIDRQTELGDARPEERLRSVIRLYSERINEQGMAIELAVRQWARSDQKAATAVARVDAARLTNVAGLYRRMGLSVTEVQTRAVLFYAFIFGQSLLFLEQTPRKRASLIAECSDVLLGVGSAAGR